jgi:hypothetical protein
MMTDYQLQPNARRCAASGRVLAAGERYYSVLVEENGRLIRRDYAAAAWDGPPADAFGFWTGRIPPEGKKRKLVLDEDTLRDCFERLEGATEPGKVRLRYVLALLILRQRRLQLEDSQREHGKETLILRDGRTGRRFRVENPDLSESELLDVQDEVLRALGWDG